MSVLVVTLTREQARERGYTGYAEHLPHLPCPKAADPRIYCASCEGVLSQLRREKVTCAR